MASGGSGTFSVPDLWLGLTSAPAGGWIWYPEPKALQYGDRTYFGYVRGDNGDVAARVITDEVAGSEIVLRAALEVDDHANPSLLVRESDHKLMVFYCAHNDTDMRYRVSTNSLDSDPTLSGGFAAEVSLDATLGGSSYTYTSPVQLTGETNDPIYLFYREGANAEWWYTVTTNDGTSWSGPTKVLTQASSTPYMKVIRTSTTRIDFCADDNAGISGNTRQWHFYYDGTWRQSDGTSLTLPASAANMTLVENTSPIESSCEDIAIGADGHPRIAFSTYNDPATDHRYRYARWTGSAWTVAQITTAGGGIDSTGYYSGGVAIDRTDPNIVYASRELSGQLEMWRYVTTDDGATWNGVVIAATSGARQIRPTAVLGATSGYPRVLWMSGTYVSFTNWSTGTRGYR